MQICQKCFDDMHMVQEGDKLKFVCDSHCGYEDLNWNLIETRTKLEENPENTLKSSNL